MSKFNVNFTKLSPQPDPKHGIPCPRSSHGLSYIPPTTDGTEKLFLYGGEHVARTPLEESQMAWIAEKNQNDGDDAWKWRLVQPSDPKPQPRVAHSQAYANGFVYIFGGRTGVDLNETALQDMWKFNVATETWTEISLKDGASVPEARSFQKMTAVDDKHLYMFGGCGMSGRCNDLHSFDAQTETWQDLGASQHLRGRGGPNVLHLASPEPRISIVAGFAGEETNDGHSYSLEKKAWEEAPLDGLGDKLRPRSVCVFGSFPQLGTALIFGGEVDPSEKGHEGAGGFANDIVVLDGKTGAVAQVVSRQDSNPTEATWPGERGWADGAVGKDDKETGSGSLYLFGGLAGDDESPVRLDDLWRCEISK